MDTLTALLAELRRARQAYVQNRSPEVDDSELAWHAWMAKDRSLRADYRAAELAFLAAVESALDAGALTIVGDMAPALGGA